MQREVIDRGSAMAVIESEVKVAAEVHQNNTNTTIVNVDDINRKITAKKCMEIARLAYDSGRTRSLKFRKTQLKNLERMYAETQEEMVEALRKDLKKPRQESYMSEIDIVQNDLRNLLFNFDKYTKPEYPNRDQTQLFDTPMIYKEPYGVVLIIGAWNYPFLVTVLPIAGAIAAGNCIIIKPSEIAPASAQYICRNLPKYLDKECYQVYSGGVAETSDLLKEKFDYIFFTGSTSIGKIIQSAAAKNLTPTTLELGGKCPVYIDETVNMELTTKRIIWGKCLNLGQTCVGPDYILCSEKTQDEFVSWTKRILGEFYGDNLKNSPDLARIATNRHFNRLISLLNNCNIALGGQVHPNERFISPTIVTNVKLTDPIMQDEIFGPILPIITIKSKEEAVSVINSKEKPLALYVFSNNSTTVDYILNATSSGGVIVNDVVVHVTCDNLPFGGVGDSGIGVYHGRKSFDTFTHRKSVLKRNFCPVSEMLYRLRYPPYSDRKTRIISFLTQKRRRIFGKFFLYLSVYVLGVLMGFLIQYIFNI